VVYDYRCWWMNVRLFQPYFMIKNGLN